MGKLGEFCHLFEGSTPGTYMSDDHLPDDELCKWQCGFGGDGEGTTRSGH